MGSGKWEEARGEKESSGEKFSFGYLVNSKLSFKLRSTQKKNSSGDHLR